MIRRWYGPLSILSTMYSDEVKERVQQIPLLTVKAGPRDEGWVDRLKEEYTSLISFVKTNKANDSDWFSLRPQGENGTKWHGTCWHFIDNIKYEFEFEIDIPVTYPMTAPDIKIPQLEGKTVKMFHGGKICLTVHFNPLWDRNVPKFGLAHAIALGLGPWLATEIPNLVANKLVL